MGDPIENVENKLERGLERPKVENREKAPESLEDKYENKVVAAEILEEPKDGSFVHAMQVFVAWVNNLLANKKDE